MFRLLGMWARAFREERDTVRTARALVANWRSRGAFLDVSDARLFYLAVFWVRAFREAACFDGVEAGRNARAAATADLCLSAVLSQGEALLHFDGKPRWSVAREVAEVPASAL